MIFIDFSTDRAQNRPKSPKIAQSEALIFEDVLLGMKLQLVVETPDPVQTITLGQRHLSVQSDGSQSVSGPPTPGL